MMTQTTRGAVFAGTILLALVAGLALAAPLLAPAQPLAIVGDPLMPPDGRRWLGTNSLGQDLFSQFVYGARASLLIGLAAAALSTALSAAIGVLAGAWARGRGVMTGLIDVFLAIPTLPLVVLIVALSGPGIWSLAITLAVLSWAAFARIVRSQVLVTLQKEFVAAARALGATEARVLRSCVLPEVAPLLFTKVVLTVRWAVLSEATLGVLGLADPGRTSWGSILQQAFSHPLLFVTGAWAWWALPPALGIVAIALGLTAIGGEVALRMNPAARAQTWPVGRAGATTRRQESDASPMATPSIRAVWWPGRIT